MSGLSVLISIGLNESPAIGWHSWKVKVHGFLHRPLFRRPILRWLEWQASRPLRALGLPLRRLLLRLIVRPRRGQVSRCLGPSPIWFPYVTHVLSTATSGAAGLPAALSGTMRCLCLLGFLPGRLSAHTQPRLGASRQALPSESGPPYTGGRGQVPGFCLPLSIWLAECSVRRAEATAGFQQGLRVG